MKDIYEVLRRKEQLVHEKHLELQQLEKEIDVLRAVVPMLREEPEVLEARRAPVPVATAATPAPKPPTMMASGGNGVAKGVQEPTSRWP